mgnify:CR=1 FL=1
MDDQAQRSRALDTTQSFLIQAPAGSGKTELLTQRYLKLLSISDSPEGVLAMTFTKKAVSELKARVISALESASKERPTEDHKQITYDLAKEVLARSNANDWRLLDIPQRLKISTIDGLSNLITSRYPQENTWVNKQIITQTWQQDKAYLQAAKQTLLSIESDEFGDCVSSVLLYLDNNVNRFYQLITLMLSKRDQWLDKLYLQDSLNVKNLKDSAEKIINQHLQKLAKQADNNFNSEFFTALASNTEEGVASISILPDANVKSLEKWRLLADLCLTGKGEWRKTLTKKNGFPAELKVQKAIILEALLSLSGKEELRSLLGGVHKLPDINFDSIQIKALEDIAQVLKIAVAQLNVLFDEQQSTDFIQVALDADQALSEHEVGDVALFLDYKIQHLLIDEFQDTSNTQFALIEKLIANWQSDDQKTLFLVGDPMQSIYLFRQSQVRLFLQVRESGIANLKPEFLQLVTNFRSGHAVIETNNAYFSSIFPQQQDAQMGAISYSPSSASKVAHQRGGVKFYPFAHQCYEQEAQQVLSIVKDNINKDVAILVRNRSHLNAIVPALKAANIEFEALKTAPLKKELFTRDLLSLTRALLDFGDKLAWLAILRAPWCGLMLSDILALATYKDRIIIDLLEDEQVLSQLTLDGANRARSLCQALSGAIQNQSRFSFVHNLEFSLEQLCPAQSLDAKSVMIKRAFLAVVDQCETLGQLDIATINLQLEELYAPSIASNIKLMTIHQAKGLEFEVVIIPGLGRAPRANQAAIIHLQEFAQKSLLLAPIKSYLDKNPSNTYRYLQHVESRQGYFESMRLLYVAMTRAKTDIHLLATLNKNNKASDNTFLKLLEPLLQHQFDALSLEKELDDKPEVPSLIRYKTMLTTQDWVETAHEKVNLDQSVNVGYKSLLGTFVHQYLELGCFEPDHQALELRLLELGFSKDDIRPALEQVLKLLKNTSSDIHFDWLFKTRKSTQVEAEFIHDGKSVIIDRLFIDEDTLWIIDFKTANKIGTEATNAFIQRQKLKHAKQLLFYKKILSNSYQNQIKCALYCPAVQEIIEIT